MILIRCADFRSAMRSDDFDGHVTIGSGNATTTWILSETMNIQQQTANGLDEAIRSARTWLLDLEDHTVRHRPSANRWSIAEVIGHLVDSACNNHQRFVRAQRCESLTFPKYEQREWAIAGGYHESPWSELVDLFSLYNLQLARMIIRIPTEQLDTECTISPYDPCTLGFLVTDYLDHLNHHLATIRERLHDAA